jgi:hypothetical protein
MTNYVNPLTGSTINPSQVGYESLSISANTTLNWPINGNNTSVVANIMDVTATVGSLSLLLPNRFRLVRTSSSETLEPTHSM